MNTPKMPTVSYDVDSGYEITLFRPDATGIKEEKLYFFEHLHVCGCSPKELNSLELAEINGSVAEDGRLYYLCARHFDVARPFLFWLKDKEEAFALRKAIHEAEKNPYKDTKCEEMREDLSLAVTWHYR
jgi:hypothetical protein